MKLKLKIEVLDRSVSEHEKQQIKSCKIKKKHSVWNTGYYFIKDYFIEENK